MSGIERIPGDGVRRPGRLRQLIRSLLPGRTLSWVVRGLVAGAGIAMLCVGIGSQAATDKMWHDASLAFFLLAATLPLWRRGERGLSGPPGRREVLRRILWRTSGILVFGAIAALTANRWYTAHGQLPAAHGISVLGVSALLLAVVPPVLEPVLWRCFPAALRRNERVGRLSEELNVSVPPPRSQLSALAASSQYWGNSRRRRPVNFFPDEGASGRPSPIREHPRGLPGGPEKVTVRSLRSDDLGALVKWDGRNIIATSRRTGRDHTLSVAPKPSAKGDRAPGRRERGVAEIVGYETHPLDTDYIGLNLPPGLFLLDADGFRILTVNSFNCRWEDMVRLAKAAGVGCSLYSVHCTIESAGKIRNLMFPRRRGHRSVKG
jgi:hypothetical protein